MSEENNNDSADTGESDDFNEDVSPPGDSSVDEESSVDESIEEDASSDVDESERVDEGVSTSEDSSAGGEESSSPSDAGGFEIRDDNEEGPTEESDRYATKTGKKSTREKRREQYEKNKPEVEEADEEEDEETREEDILIETPEEKQEEKRQEEAKKITSQEFNWREEANEAWEKIQVWREDDDSDEAEDVRTAPGRAKEYFLENKSARDYIFDIVLPLTLTVYGFLLLVASVAVAGSNDLLAQVLTQPHRVADLFLLDSFILLVAAVAFVLARKFSSGLDTSTDIWRRRLRKFVIALHLLPTLVFALVIWNFVQPGIVEEWAIWFFEWRVYLSDVLPGGLVGVGEAVWNVTPIGVTVQQIAALMFLLGLVLAIPFAMGIVKVFIVAINTEAERELSQLEALKITGGQRESRSSASTTSRDRQIDESRGEEVGEGSLYGIEDVDALFSTNEDYAIEPYPDYEEHKRYWVNKPYAYVVILYNDKTSDYRYYVIEPELTSKEERIYEELNDRLSRELLFENVEERIKNEEPRDGESDQEAESRVKTRILEDKSLQIAQEYNITINDKSFQKIMYYLRRDYVEYGKIDPIMKDPNSEDISCDGDDQEIFLFHQEYEDVVTNVKFQSDELRAFIIQLAQRSGEHISAADPMCDASLPDGSRAQLTLGDEVTTHGSTFTLRIFQDVPFTPVDLITTETFNVNQIAYLWLAIEHDMSLIFAGGTASGKTTTMNAISLFIPPKSKIVSLEDTRELTLPHSNWVPSVTRDSFGGDEVEEIDMYDLLEAALRQRPEYLLVGEVRGEEARTLFQAMSTGHTTYSTMHADTVDAAVYRLTNPPINVPEEMIQALDILAIQNQINIYDEEEEEVKRVRRNEKIGEIERQDNGFRVSEAYHRDAQRDEFVEDIDDSGVLGKIQDNQGWTVQELRRQLKERQRVLNYMVDNGFDDVTSVTRIVQAYIVNSERVMERLEDGSLHPDDFDDLAAIETFDDEWDLPDTVLPHELEQEVRGEYA